MKKVIKRGLGVLLAILMVIAILPSITINAKAASGVDNFVTRCYQVAFQRTPDTGGFNYWKAKITNGELVGSTVVYNFIFSPEYEAQNRTDKDFVNDLYTMFMGRAADQEGYDYWCGQIKAGMSRKDVFAGFANSKEFYELCVSYGITSGYYTNEYDLTKVNNVNLFVERLYKTCLGRIGDQGGQKYWVEGLLKGELTGIGCAANYIKSPEYEALGLNNEKYVENLYIGFMGRTYDKAGKANWLGHLTKKTKTRDQVFEGFANSPEFQGICAGYGIDCGSYTATDIAKPIKVKNIFYLGSVLTEVYEYDSNGNGTKYTLKNIDGSLSYRTEQEYDSKGNNIKFIKYNSDETVDFWQEYQYDSHDNLIKITNYNNDGSIDNWSEYKYDSKGNKIKFTYYNNDGSIKVWDIYEYDSNDNMIKRTEYNNDGSIKYWNEYQYDSKGNNIKMIDHSPDGTIDAWNEYQYDSAGNMIKNTDYKNDGSISRWIEYQYDSKGNMIKYTSYKADGSIDWANEYQYDSKGYMIKYTEYKGTIMLYYLEYKYEFY